MNNNNFLLSFLISAAAMYSCNEPAKETVPTATDSGVTTLPQDTTAPAVATGDNSRTSLDWPGTYKGIVPCADCEGIETTITIGIDSSYTLTTSYLGKKDARTFEKKGTFVWNTDGGSIRLAGITNGPDQYLVGENKLIQLDLQGRPITGNNAARYQLKKLSSVTTAPAAEGDETLTVTYWKLTELMGKPLTKDASGKEVFLRFNKKDSSVKGNGGCNNFFGKYQLMNNYRIQFSPIASTKMACEKMEQEIQFFKIFEKTDSYIIKANKLQLVRARMAPLAVFEAVPGK